MSLVANLKILIKLSLQNHTLNMHSPFEIIFVLIK